MVSKKSEYRNQYRKAILVSNIPTYFESLTYRNRRKEQEYTHTPISWDFEQEEPELSSPEEEVEKLPVDKLELSDIEEGDEGKKKEADLKEDIQKEKLKLQADDGKDKDDILIERQTSESRQLTKLAKEKLNKYTSLENRDSPEKEKPALEKIDPDEEVIKPKQVDDKTFVKRSKPRRPDRTRTIPSRPKSAAGAQRARSSLSSAGPKRVQSSQSRPKSASSLVQSSEERPPFVMYGCGDSERATGIKKTHNVHCSTDIYPAALKALQQHQKRVQRREEMQRKISARERKKKNLFAEKITKETSAWQSEYRQRYPTYDLSEYERRLKALEFARSRKVKNDF